MAFSKGDIAAPFIQVKEDENGVLQDIKFVNDDNFNFAYDVVDKMAKKDPDKVAMLHISKDGKERSFTFYDMARYSSKVANYLQFLGIKKGDRVMLVLKRHYQFWFAILALHKIGAVAIPATNLLLKSDFEYRFKAGNVDAILCTADGPVLKWLTISVFTSREMIRLKKSSKQMNLRLKLLFWPMRLFWIKQKVTPQIGKLTVRLLHWVLQKWKRNEEFVTEREVIYGICNGKGKEKGIEE